MEASFSQKTAKAFGLMTAREVQALKVVAGYAAASTPGERDPVFVNFGAGVGTSGLALREAEPFATIYTLDTEVETPFGGMQNERNAFKDTGLELPIQIMGDSAEIGRTWDKGVVDLVFIDGDHSKPQVEKDIRAWLPHIRKYGYVVFHDRGHPLFPGVKELIDLYFQDRRPIIDVDTLVAFKIYGNELRRKHKDE